MQFLWYTNITNEKKIYSTRKKDYITK